MCDTQDAQKITKKRQKTGGRKKKDDIPSLKERRKLALKKFREKKI